MEKYFDINGKQITEGCKVESVDEYDIQYAQNPDDLIFEVFVDEDEDELAINQDGTTIYLLEIETEKVLKIIE